MNESAHRVIRCTLNGKPTDLDVRTDDTLLDVLRREGLRSVRATCGIGICGACTVLVDGGPISACLTLAPLAYGTDILTVEGLATGDALHPIQQAFVECMGFQCSYCTPGMILSATALLAERPDPSTDDIRDYLSGNLCRCGSYVKIVESVLLAAQRLRSPTSDADTGG